MHKKTVNISSKPATAPMIIYTIELNSFLSVGPFVCVVGSLAEVVVSATKLERELEMK